MWEDKQKFSISALNLQVALAMCFCNLDLKYMYKQEMCMLKIVVPWENTFQVPACVSVVILTNKCLLTIRIYPLKFSHLAASQWSP